MLTYMNQLSKKIRSHRIIKENILYSGNWAEMVEFEYEDEEKTTRKYIY